VFARRGALRQGFRVRLRSVLHHLLQPRSRPPALSSKPRRKVNERSTIGAFGVLAEVSNPGTSSAKWTEYLSVGKRKVGMRTIQVASETLDHALFPHDHLGSRLGQSPTRPARWENGCPTEMNARMQVLGAQIDGAG